MKWQPISTAPLDGTEVLLWGIRDGEINGLDKNYSMNVCSFKFKRWSVTGTDAYNVEVQSPTHWAKISGLGLPYAPT